MKEDDLVITITEVKPVSKPLKPGYIEVLPNRYVVGSSSRLCGGRRMSDINELLGRISFPETPEERDEAWDKVVNRVEVLEAAIKKALESEDSTVADDVLRAALEAAP